MTHTLIIQVFPAGPHFRLPVDPQAAGLIPASLARKLLAIPIAQQGPVLTVAMSDPQDSEACGQLQALTRLRLRPVAAAADDILRVLPGVYAE